VFFFSFSLPIDLVHLFSFTVSSEEAPSDSEDLFNTDESGNETTEFDQNPPTESSSSASPDSQGQLDRHKTAADTAPATPKAPASKASQTAANLRLNLTLADETDRHSRMLGLPTSPRPSHSPSSAGNSQELSTPSPVR
jgi:RalA-binding protein 1